MPPLLLTALRYVVATLHAIFFIKRPQVALRLLIAYGFVLGVGEFGLLFLAIRLGMPSGPAGRPSGLGGRAGTRASALATGPAVRIACR